jgi:hypothetical protein
LAGDRLDGRGGVEQIAAALIELPGERIKNTNGSIGLRGVPVKLDADPAVVAGRFCVDAETYGTAHFLRRDPGKMLRSLGRVLRGEFSK